MSHLGSMRSTTAKTLRSTRNATTAFLMASKRHHNQSCLKSRSSRVAKNLVISPELAEVTRGRVAQGLGTVGILEASRLAMIRRPSGPRGKRQAHINRQIDNRQDELDLQSLQLGCSPKQEGRGRPRCLGITPLLHLRRYGRCRRPREPPPLPVRGIQ